MNFSTFYFLSLVLVVFAPSLQAEIIPLKNGMTLIGIPGTIESVGTGTLSPLGDSSSTELKLICVVDDGLRRTFIPKKQIVSLNPEVEILQSIRLKQKPGPTLSGATLGNIAPAPWPPSPFDEWGRRVYPILTPKGKLEVIQGITRITPVYTSIEALQTENAVHWDMRVGTGSIPRDVLQKVLLKHLNMEKMDDRLKLVRLFLQSLRYADAEAELREILAKFPDRPELAEQLREIQRLDTRQKVDEIKLRQNAGQHALVRHLLQQLMAADIPVEILGEVQELEAAYETQESQARQILEFIKGFADEVKDAATKTIVEDFHKEVETHISVASLPRFAEYLRLSKVEGVTKETQFALALSGWILGGTGVENLSTATTLVEIRALVARYLITESESERREILDKLQSREGASPENIARILATIDPPKATELIKATPTPAPGAESTSDPPPTPTPELTKNADGSESAKPVPVPETPPGLLELACPGLSKDETFKYLVQLPPEYSPQRRYPVLMTLHGSSSTPGMQLDWWAGMYDPKLQMRLGQASRHGYIVLAPAWLAPGIKRYDYSGKSHAKILFSLRDAMQRFSIDTDRIYLTGFLEGGEAAWDIGLAHPDLWAGVIPVQAVANRGTPDSPRYINHLWENARYVSFYFLHGDKDGLKVSKNASEFDRYLSKSQMDVMVVEYQGRGEEHFSDDIHRLFEWMRNHVRRPIPTEFEARSRRPWDNFFWNVEVEGLPPQAMIAPEAWPARNTVMASAVKSSVKGMKKVAVSCKANAVTVFLTPEIVDFTSDVTVTINGRPPIRDCRPDIAVLLEDARTRCDRLHPFWAKCSFTRNER